MAAGHAAGSRRSYLLLLIAALACPVALAALDQTYHRVLTAGDLLGGEIFGLSRTKDGKPIFATDYEKSAVLDKQEVSNSQDFTALIKVKDTVYMTVHTEYFPPSNIFVVEMEQNKDTGALKAKDMKTADFSKWGGLWLACSGSTTQKLDGKTLILGAEEYEPNAKPLALATNLTELRTQFEADPAFYGYADLVNFMRYFGKYPFDNNLNLPVLTFKDLKTLFNPYMYGYITTLEVQPGGSSEVSKLMALGRFSHELGYVMPDKRTVYMSDDNGTGGGLFMFVADKAGDFSRGTLYACKVTQTTPAGGDPAASSFKVEWIKLGKGHQPVLRAMAERTTFTDIFEVAAGSADGTCPMSFTSINTATGFECLKLKKGKEQEAAFLETRRYAAMMGATTEFSKGEGLVYSQKTGELYFAISNVRYGMEDNASKGKPSTSYDKGGPNHVKLAYTPCGCIFSMSLDGSYQGTQLKGKLCGKTIAADAAGNTCARDGIAGPDNLEVLEDTLIIAEDSEGFHVQNFLWAMDIPTGALTRIYKMEGAAYTTAEFTSPYLYTVNGHKYLVTNINNYDENGKVKGAVGYFGPWKFGKDDKPVFTNVE